MEERGVELIHSKVLQKAIMYVDDTLLRYENTIKNLELEIKELQEEKGEALRKQLEDGNKLIANTLMTLVGKPLDLSVITPVGANILANIMKMSSLKEVKSYVKSLVKNWQDQNVKEK